MCFVQLSQESHLRTCGTDRTVPFHPSSDEAAVRDACENDKALLRSKVEALGGGEALGRFDAAMAAALSRVEAEEDAAAAAEDDAASDAEGADPGADTAVTQTHPGEASQATASGTCGEEGGGEGGYARGASRGVRKPPGRTRD